MSDKIQTAPLMINTPRDQFWTEIHHHLDVSMPSSTLLEFAQQDGIIPQSTSLAHFEADLFLTQPLADLASVLGRFALFPRTLNRPERLERVAFEVARRAWLEDIRTIEFRYSPQYLYAGGGTQGLDWETQLLAFRQGLARAEAQCEGLRTGLILIASREFGAELAHATVQFTLKHWQDAAPGLPPVIGVDLAGDEMAVPNSEFTAAWQPARKAQLPITIHAGEAAGPDSVWSALEDLGARRIGHGVTSFQDSQLVEVLRSRQVCLEMCPTSNWITQCVQDLGDHPLRLALEQGVRACINTDDPGIFNRSLAQERKTAIAQCGLKPEDLMVCEKNAQDALFLVAPPTEQR